MKKRSYLTIFILLIIGFSAKASHIVGGDFTYRWINGNKFELTLKLYRDCNTPVAFDPDIVIGVFDKVTNLRADTLQMSLVSSGNVTLSGPAASCTIPPEICVEEGIYIDTLNLSNNSNGYYLVWERCCRNASVINMDNPNLTGIAFYLEMPNPALHNSSPAFNFDPLPFMCEGQPLNYSFAATDIDGDQLVYELVNPLAGNIGYPTASPQPVLPTPLPGPYASVLYTPGFSLSNVCGSSTNPLAVNPTTGNVSVTVDYSGLYSMAVAIHEFRNGVEIGLVRREIEFSVIICPNSPVVLNVSIPVNSSSPTVTVVNNSTITAYETDSIHFLMTADDGVDSIYMTVSGDVFGGGSISPPYATANLASGLTVAFSNFIWKTVCGQARATPYKVVYKAVDNGCPLPATSVDTINITLYPAPVIDSINLICIGLRDNLSTEIFWVTASTINARFFKQLEIYRSKNGSPFALIGTVTDPAAGSFTDLTASDYLSNDYCYYIKGINSCSVAGLPSDTLCTISQFNEKINYIRQVSVKDAGKVELVWRHFPDGPYSTFYIYRKENIAGSNFSLRKTLEQPSYDSWIDEEVTTTEKSYSYYLVNQDYCGNISPQSNEASTILLKGTSGHFENSLNWSSYSNWNGGVKQYEIYRKPIENSIFSKIKSQPDGDIIFTDNDLDLSSGQFIYYIKAIEDTGSLDGESLSNEITLNQFPLGFLPAGFTPNEDNINDVWGLSSSFIKDFKLSVYDRWGNLVFYSDNKNLFWDGTYKSKKLAIGTYVYTISYTGYDSNDKITKTGTVTLLK